MLKSGWAWQKMKSFKIILLLINLGISFNLFAQSQADPSADEGMDLFLLIFALAVISLMIGAAVAGSVVATLALLFLFAFISVGIISVSVLAGLYKKSISSGSKTLTYLICSITGMFSGAIGVWIIFRLLKIEISDTLTLVTGILSGLTGGVLMAYAVIRIFPSLISYFREKYFAGAKRIDLYIE